MDTRNGPTLSADDHDLTVDQEKSCCSCDCPNGPSCTLYQLFASSCCLSFVSFNDAWWRQWPEDRRSSDHFKWRWPSRSNSFKGIQEHDSLMMLIEMTSSTNCLYQSIQLLLDFCWTGQLGLCITWYRRDGGETRNWARSLLISRRMIVFCVSPQEHNFMWTKKYWMDDIKAI